MSRNNDPGQYENIPAKVSYTLEKAWKIESKTKQIPFVVAQELDNSENPEGPSRQFLVFNDLSHFLYLKDTYPNIHEIIRCPNTVYDNDVEYRDDLCKGRLIFDFDLEKPLSTIKVADMNNPNTFVPYNFTYLLEDIIKETFNRYYNIDLDKLEFGWQYSPNPTKFSMHLIVRHAYFSEYWVQQINTFYSLFKFVAADMDLSYLMEAVDWQIARRNGTFRMIGSAKINGGALKLISYRKRGQEVLQRKSADQVDPEKLLCGIYNYKTLRKEQHITLDKINYLRIKATLDKGNNPELEKKINKHLNIDHLRKEKNSFHEEGEENKGQKELENNYENSISIFEQFNDGSYKIKSCRGNFISLQRLKASECPVSGEVHEHENPFLIMSKNGLLIFRCRRGCKNKNGFEGYVLGTYNKTYLEDPKNINLGSLIKKGLNFNKEQITSKKKVEVEVDEIMKNRNNLSSPMIRVDQNLVERIRNCKTVTAIGVVMAPDIRKGKPSAKLRTISTKYEIKIPRSLVK